MKYLTFKELQSLGIVSSWPTLGRMIEHSGFPAGVRLSASKRAWAEDEVRAWLSTRAIQPMKPATTSANAAAIFPLVSKLLVWSLRLAFLFSLSP